MRITNLTLLAFYLNSAVDSKKYQDVSVQDVGKVINNGTIFDYLEQKMAGDIDLSIFDAEKRKALQDEWADMYNAIDARRKFGVEQSGLCLLVAYLLEGIQRRQDNNPPV